jgi:hypothetical protein
MRYPPIAAALMALGGCASAPAASPASPVNVSVPTAPTAPSPAVVASSPAVAPLTPGTFGPGLYEPEFRHGDVRRYRSYLFFADGRFEYRIAGYERLPSVACSFRDAVAYGGTWRREGDAVRLHVTWEDTIRGGHAVESPERGCTEEGGAFLRTTLQAPRGVSLALGACATGFLHEEAPCVLLDGAPWYRTSPEGTDARDAWYAWCAALPASQRTALCHNRR